MLLKWKVFLRPTLNSTKHLKFVLQFPKMLMILEKTESIEITKIYLDKLTTFVSIVLAYFSRTQKLDGSNLFKIQIFGEPTSDWEYFLTFSYSHIAATVKLAEENYNLNH